MKRIPHMILAGLVAFATTAPAFADPPHGRGWDRQSDNRGWRDDRRDGRNDNNRDGWRDDRRYDDRRDYRDDRRAYTNGYRDGRQYDSYRDYGYDSYAYRAPVTRYWGRGDYIPRGTRYVVVQDYGRYHLPPPRHGHYYADYGNGDVLLVAAATGLVVWALSQNRY
jgi:Ni/Co efflux regulator RcnB